MALSADNDHNDGNETGRRGIQEPETPVNLLRILHACIATEAIGQRAVALARKSKSNVQPDHEQANLIGAQ